MGGLGTRVPDGKLTSEQVLPLWTDQVVALNNGRLLSSPELPPWAA